MFNRSLFQEMEQLQREVNNVFGSFFGPSRCERSVAFLPGLSARSYPRVNVREDGEKYIIDAVAPGIDPENLNISIVGNVITLSGEKKRQKDEIRSEAYHRSERAAGRFVRTFELPSEVDHAGVQAEYKNGLIHITLPKKEEAKPKKIEVKVA